MADRAAAEGSRCRMASWKWWVFTVHFNLVQVRHGRRVAVRVAIVMLPKDLIVFLLFLSSKSCDLHCEIPEVPV